MTGSNSKFEQSVNAKMSTSCSRVFSPSRQLIINPHYPIPLHRPTGALAFSIARNRHKNVHIVMGPLASAHELPRTSSWFLLCLGVHFSCLNPPDCSTKLDLVMRKLSWFSLLRELPIHNLVPRRREPLPKAHCSSPLRQPIPSKNPASYLPCEVLPSLT